MDTTRHPNATPVDPPRVLIVEDVVASREMLQRLLEFEGYFVLVAADGRTAMDYMQQQRPDVAVIDIGLPDINGYEMARRIRSNPRNLATLLIALSGHGQLEDIQKSRQAGFDAHLVKPLRFEALLDLLRKISPRV